MPSISSMGNTIKSYGAKAKDTAGGVNDALDSNLGTIRTIEQIRTMDSPQRSYKWLVQMPLIGNVNVSGFVEEINVPWPSISAEPHYEAGSNTYFPGEYDIDSFDITFYTDQSGTLERYLARWRSYVVTSEGLRNLPVAYKKRIIATLLSTQNIPKLIIHLDGVWPTSKTPTALSQESSRVRTTQTFSVDSGNIVEPEQASNGLIALLPDSVKGGLNVIRGQVDGKIRGKLGDVREIVGSESSKIKSVKFPSF